MIIILKDKVNEKQVANLTRWLEGTGFDLHISKGQHQTIIGLIGDGSTAALVGRDGSIGWLCVPRFDSAPLFCSMLDQHRGGFWRLAPDEVVEARQRYERGTGVLATELRSPSICMSRRTLKKCWW